MMRLAKYVKPYAGQLLLAIALLFVQANADLALPDYMSRIVNTGIQQGGVENAVPMAIRQSQMERLFLFMSAEDKAAVLADYDLVDAGSAGSGGDAATDGRDVPTGTGRDVPSGAGRDVPPGRLYAAAAGEPVYVLKDVEQAEIERLNPVMGKALLVVSTIQKVMADPAQAAAMGQQLGVDLSRLPAGMDPFALLPSLPAAQKAAMMGAIDERLGIMGDSFITQSAVAAVRNEYIALGIDMGRQQNAFILRTGLLMLLVTLVSVIAVVVVSYLSARISAGLARDLRRAVFARVEAFSSSEFDRFSTASLITRSTNDVTQLQMVAMMMVRLVFYAPIIGIGGVIRAMSKGSSMWWVIALAVAILLALVVIVYLIAVPRFKSIQALIDRLNLVVRENLSGMMVIRAFNRQPSEEERFDKANRDLTATMLFVGRVMVVLMPVMMFVMSSLSILIIWVGAHQVAQSNMQVGDMMAFIQYTMQIIFAFVMLSMMFIMLPRAAVSAGRVSDVLETEPAIVDPPSPQRFAEPFRGAIEFRNVTFRYPGAEEDVLHDISFVAQPGQTTAFIGSTGSGKSTIVSLIPRFYDVTAGAILVDGLDIREVAQGDLRGKIGYVPQRGMLFSGTIESNLRYADEDAEESALVQAVEVAQAGEFVFSGSEGLAAEIAQGGGNVSGGQKQRLSIARALVKKPPIYIFDDSFSALDFQTDAALRRALKKHTADSAVLIVTQRVSTIKNADQIVVLSEGRIVGKGTHRDLMASCDVYQEIALSQLSKEELA